MGYSQLEPIEVNRDKKNGMWFHPDLKAYFHEHFVGVEHLDEKDWDQVTKDLGVTFQNIEIFDDEEVDDEIIQRLLEEGDITAIIDWNPIPPDGDTNWFLVQIYENEDGVSALWAKKMQPSFTPENNTAF